MALILRLSVIWIILGLITGFVLRAQFRGNVSVPFYLSFAPFVAHLLYITLKVQQAGAVAANQLLLFLGISAFLGLAVFWVGFRSLQRGGNSLIFLPGLLGIMYGVGPLLWLASLERAADRGFDSLPNILLAGGTMFVVSMLLVFKVGALGGGGRVQRPPRD